MSQFPVEKHTNSVIAVELAMQKWLEKHKEQTKSTVQVVYHLEIEFYLTDLFLYRSRPDLMLCGRTLQGLSPSENLFPYPRTRWNSLPCTGFPGRCTGKGRGTRNGHKLSHK